MFPRPVAMGAKYLPNNRDLKASRRFEKQLPKFKPAPVRPLPATAQTPPKP